MKAKYLYMILVAEVLLASCSGFKSSFQHKKYLYLDRNRSSVAQTDHFENDLANHLVVFDVNQQHTSAVGDTLKLKDEQVLTGNIKAESHWKVKIEVPTVPGARTETMVIKKKLIREVKYDEHIQTGKGEFDLSDKAVSEKSWYRNKRKVSRVLWLSPLPLFVGVPMTIEMFSLFMFTWDSTDELAVIVSLLFLITSVIYLVVGVGGSLALFMVARHIRRKFMRVVTNG